MKSPYPWFGGKGTVAEEVWTRFGNVPNYVEPFFGSGAVLLARPHEIGGQVETVNDKDCMVSNFWRALQSDPDAVAHYADWPVIENDLHARHAWLVGRKGDVRAKVEGDPEWFDAKVAGWWCWGLACWIGGEFCSGNGPWSVVDGELVRDAEVDKGQGVSRKRVHLGDKGQGVNRQLVHLGEYMQDLADRMRRVRVCSGDWSRVCGDTPTVQQGTTGVFLDPPYSVGDRVDCYAEECRSVAHDVREWALERGDDERFRIALCGYDGEHSMPGWSEFSWKTQGGYGGQGDGVGRKNASRERIWFSPHCLDARQSEFKWG